MISGDNTSASKKTSWTMDYVGLTPESIYVRCQLVFGSFAGVILVFMRTVVWLCHSPYQRVPYSIPISTSLYAEHFRG